MDRHRGRRLLPLFLSDPMGVGVLGPNGEMPDAIMLANLIEEFHKESPCRPSASKRRTRQTLSRLVRKDRKIQPFRISEHLSKRKVK